MFSNLVLDEDDLDFTKGFKSARRQMSLCVSAWMRVLVGGGGGGLGGGGGGGFFFGGGGGV